MTPHEQLAILTAFNRSGGTDREREVLLFLLLQAPEYTCAPPPAAIRDVLRCSDDLIKRVRRRLKPQPWVDISPGVNVTYVWKPAEAHRTVEVLPVSAPKPQRIDEPMPPANYLCQSIIDAYTEAHETCGRFAPMTGWGDVLDLVKYLYEARGRRDIARFLPVTATWTDVVVFICDMLRWTVDSYDQRIRREVGAGKVFAGVATRIPTLRHLCEKGADETHSTFMRQVQIRHARPPAGSIAAIDDYLE